MNSVYNLEKLNGDNYSSWSILMKSVLIQVDYWDYVCGVIRAPEPGAADAKIKECKEWKDKDNKALSTIILGLSPSVLIYVKHCETSKAAWDTLNKVFNPNGPAQKVTLLKQLARFKMNSSLHVPSQIVEFYQLAEKLREIELDIPEELLSILLLTSLPECYENFTVAIESRDTLPSLNDLKVKILEECNRLTEKDNSDSKPGTENVLAIKYKSRDDQVSTKSNKKNCFYCGKSGHYAAYCRQKKENQKRMNQKTNKKPAVAFSATIHDTDSDFMKNNWYLDSGATAHMCNNINLFDGIDYNESDRVISATGETGKVLGVGDIKIETKFSTVTLQNVLYVPSLKGNFISVSKINKSGLTVKFFNSVAIVERKDGEKILLAHLENNLYMVDTILSGNPSIHAIRDLKSDFNLWHRRYGHLNAKSLLQLHKRDMVTGLDRIEIPNGFKCEICVKGKMVEKSFPRKGNSVTSGILDLIHSDVCGPMRVASIGGARYFITLVDDFSRKVYVRFLKAKSEALKVFKEFKNLVENQTGRKIKCLRSDNGKEYINNEFSEFLAQCGIKRQLSAPYSPQQNGVAERLNRTLTEMARCFLIESGLPESLWAEAVNTAAYVRNRSPSKITQNKTPQELWNGRKPSVRHFRAFGAKAIVMETGKLKSKFAARGEEMILVGYSEESKAYRLYNNKSRNIVVSRNVEFFEDKLPFQKEHNETLNNFEFCYTDDSLETQTNDEEDKRVNHKGETTREEIENEESCDDDEENVAEELECMTSDDHTSPSPQPRKARGRPLLLRTGKRGRPKKIFKEKVAIIVSRNEEIPKSVTEALSGPNANNWRKAMQVEYDSLIKNKTWELTERPNGQNVIGSKWVFATKKGNDGTVVKYKARLVAQGFAQSYGIDYFDTSAPVVKASSIRLLLALAVEMEYIVHHMDITSAYLHGELSETVYMKQPEEFIEPQNKTKVCKLKRSIYGLKQAGRVWNEKLNDVLKNVGFARCEADRCIYLMRRETRSIFLAVYVDDLILACQEEDDATHVKLQIGKELKIEDKGLISQYLNIIITRENERGPLSLSQKRYIIDILKEYKMEQCKITKTPLDPGMRFKECTGKECKKINEDNYRSLIGSLNYLAVWTRPDISCAVSKLAQFCSHPHEEQWKGALHILRYLRGTLDYRITYWKTNNKIECFVDADWGGEELDRKSYSGYSLHMAGGAVTWYSKKQTTVSLSSTEAEYTAISEATREILHIKHLLMELHVRWPVQHPIVIWNDNLSAQNAIRNGKTQGRMKHLDIKIHFVRDNYEKNIIDIKYIDTNSMKADILTKILNPAKHKKCVENILNTNYKKNTVLKGNLLEIILVATPCLYCYKLL